MKKLTYNGSVPQNITYNGTPVRTVKYNGVTVWTKEQTFPGLSVSVSNYVEYHTTHSGTSSGSIDARGFDTLTFSWSLSTSMQWANGSGVSSTSRVYVKMADGTTIQIGSKTGKLYTAGSTYTSSGTATVDISGYSEAAKNGIQLYATLGDMSASSPQAGSDRHNLSASTGTITAS